MTPSAADLIRVLPEILWCGFGVLLMLLQPILKNRQGLTLFAMLGAAAGTLATYFGQMGSGFFGLIQFDTYSLFFHWLVGLVAFLVILASDSYLERENLAPAEFYALILFATAGMGVLASAQELLTAFIGLEMSSISSYVLAGYRRDAVKSSESAVKYFLLGSFATAFFLYGIALVYGASGSTNLMRIASADSGSNLLRLGLTLILVGLGFKVAAAPFQVWTPDVYEGAPTPVTALFSAGPKAATFALLLRIFTTIHAATDFWFWAFWILAVATMFVGNLGALVQTNVKRMLAYSSIAHAGYTLVAFDDHEAGPGDRGGSGLCGGAVLPAGLFAGEGGRVHDRFRDWRAGRELPDVGRLRRARYEAAVCRRGDDPVPAFPAGAADHGGILRKVLCVQGSHQFETDLAGSADDD
jgi:NADH-quinone oxidoreductase subunit N